LNALRQGASESKILALAKIQDPKIRAGLLKSLESTTRSEIEGKSIEADAKGTKKSGRKLSPDDARIADEIQRALGLKVVMVRAGGKSGKGKLTVEFYSDDDLQMVFRKLVAEG
jgi:hypothetical protein